MILHHIVNVFFSSSLRKNSDKWIRFTRLNHPVGILLLLWPCWFAIAWSAPQFPSISLLLLFAIGAVVMRSSGCMINDFVDKDIDSQVARTKNRPLASGEISPQAALVAIVLLNLVGAIILFSLNMPTIIIGILSVILVISYPFMKRITYWPQAFLGLTFNIGALMGWTAMAGTWEWKSLLLYLAGICWTLGYDTIYAHQDKEDDLLVGIGSTALLWGKKSKQWISLFYGLMIALLLMLGLITGLNWLFFVGMLGVTALLYKQVKEVDLDNPLLCARQFNDNIWVGAMLFLAIIAGKLPL